MYIYSLGIFFQLNFYDIGLQEQKESEMKMELKTKMKTGKHKHTHTLTRLFVVRVCQATSTMSITEWKKMLSIPLTHPQCAAIDFDFVCSPRVFYSLRNLFFSYASKPSFLSHTQCWLARVQSMKRIDEKKWTSVQTNHTFCTIQRLILLQFFNVPPCSRTVYTVYMCTMRCVLSHTFSFQTHPNVIYTSHYST